MHAFGYCFDTLDPQNPDRLCRGRERWIEPILDPAAEPLDRVYCLVVSGADFSDDSARDATRGLVQSGVSAASLLRAIFPGAALHAFREVGDPRALPPIMAQEEDWTYAPMAGRRRTPAVRWIAPITEADADTYMLGTYTSGPDAGLAAPRADGILVDAILPDDGPAELADALFQLVGFSDPDGRPAVYYNAIAIPEVLKHARALILFHLDKHGPAFTVYSLDPFDVELELIDVARAAGSFPVPFGIPPMLARWDRALYELRLGWDADAHGPFPVPPADDAGGRWSARRRPFDRGGAEFGEDGGDAPDGGDGEEE